MAEVGPHMFSGLATTSLSCLDFFGDLRMRHDYRKWEFSMDDDEPMTKLDAQHYLNYAGTSFAGPSITFDENEGLHAAQKCMID